MTLRILNRTALSLLCLIALSASSPLLAQAREYKVEIIVFENVNGGSDIRAGLSFPRMRNILSLDSADAANLGFELLDSGYELNEIADKIRNSGKYRLLRHFMWQQPGLDERDAKAVRVSVGSVSTMYIPENPTGSGRFLSGSSSPQPGREREIRTTTVNGTIKVRLGRFLHMETHLVYTDAERSTSYNLYQSRKMRSRELHYIDNARFGIVARICSG